MTRLPTRVFVLVCSLTALSCRSEPCAFLCDGLCLSEEQAASDPNNCGACGRSCGVFPCVAGECVEVTEEPELPIVDLLLVIDNSFSMDEEQFNLYVSFPAFFAGLTSGDRDGDGTADQTPISSLHVGVITTDMGSGPSTVPTCTQGLGDDGILRNRGRLASSPCVASYPSAVFEFERDRGDDPQDLTTSVRCVAAVGTGGCGFAQQLESALKALTPTSASEWTRPGYSPPRFLSADGFPDATPGNADGPNAGFLRPDSILTVLLVTDGEDCSVTDYGLFAQDDPRFEATHLNLRCWTYGDPERGVVYPTARYVDGLLGLRTEARRLVFAGIIGIPPETEALADAGDYAGVLADPRMIPRPSATGTGLETSCSTINGVAYPPIRIVEVGRDLRAQGANVSLSSICTTNFDYALGRVSDILGDLTTRR